MTLKCISLWQPYASLVAIGAKRNETRSYRTNNRGLIGIHASLNWTKLQREIVEAPPFTKYVTAEEPRGFLIGLVEIYDVMRTEEWLETHESIERDSEEVTFGNYQDGRFVWRLRNAMKLLRPVPMKAKQGFFNIEIDAALLK